MKLNYLTATSCQKLIEADESEFHTFYEKHTATEAAADAPGEKWKGCMI